MRWLFPSRAHMSEHNRQSNHLFHNLLFSHIWFPDNQVQHTHPDIVKKGFLPQKADYNQHDLLYMRHSARNDYFHIVRQIVRQYGRGLSCGWFLITHQQIQVFHEWACLVCLRFGKASQKFDSKNIWNSKLLPSTIKCRFIIILHAKNNLKLIHLQILKPI